MKNLILAALLLMNIAIADSSNGTETYLQNVIEDTINSSGPSIRKHYKEKGLPEKKIENKVKLYATAMAECHVELMASIGQKYLDESISRNLAGVSVKKSIEDAVALVKADVMTGKYPKEKARSKLNTYNHDLAVCTKEKVSSLVSVLKRVAPLILFIHVGVATALTFLSGNKHFKSKTTKRAWYSVLWLIPVFGWLVFFI